MNGLHIHVYSMHMHDHTNTNAHMCTKEGRQAGREILVCHVCLESQGDI